RVPHERHVAVLEAETHLAHLQVGHGLLAGRFGRRLRRRSRSITDHTTRRMVVWSRPAEVDTIAAASIDAGQRWLIAQKTEGVGRWCRCAGAAGPARPRPMTRRRPPGSSTRPPH